MSFLFYKICAYLKEQEDDRSIDTYDKHVRWREITMGERNDSRKGSKIFDMVLDAMKAAEEEDGIKTETGNAAKKAADVPEETPSMEQNDSGKEGTSSTAPDANASDGKLAEPKESIFTRIEQQIRDSDLPEAEKVDRISRLMRMSHENVNILFVGATGSGKSSTINALFDMEVAKVGYGVDPETNSITKYELENLIIWDTPGLGDGKQADKDYKDMLVHKLNEKDGDGNLLIDLVLVVLDASSKDLGTSYDLISNVIIPCLGDDAEKRILIGLNQADVAMKGRHWNAEANEPDETLKDYLKKKAESVRQRIFEATDIYVRPVFYCAGYKEEDGEQCRPYNLTKLLYYILNSVPEEKRLVIADNINPDEDAWLHDDEEKDYSSDSFSDAFDNIGIEVGYYASEFGDIGAEILGIPGRVAGMVVGAGIGVIAGIFGSVF